MTFVRLRRPLKKLNFYEGFIKIIIKGVKKQVYVRSYELYRITIVNVVPASFVPPIAYIVPEPIK